MKRDVTQDKRGFIGSAKDFDFFLIIVIKNTT